MRIKNYEQLILNGRTAELQKKRRDVLDVLSAAVDAVDPYLAVERVFDQNRMTLGAELIDLSRFDHVYVVGFGKASVPMAHAVCDAVPEIHGAVVTNDSSAVLPYSSVEVVVGGHPLPTEGSMRGTEKVLGVLRRCGPRDCVVVLVSGGGSSLLCKPVVPLEDLRSTILLLLRAGADINELNVVRKHLSLVKGGRLAASTAATLVTLIISDIVHDPIPAIASGPTSPDSSSFSDAKSILARYLLWEKVPGSVRKVLDDGIAGRIPETVKQGDPVFQKVHTAVVANNQLACDHAVKKASALGYRPILLTLSLIGEARTVGPYLIEKAAVSMAGKDAMFISGGEPTVTVKGQGVGGRNQELVLSCVEALAGRPWVVASVGTDGIDGNSSAAGALADGDSLARASEKRLDLQRFLEENNSFGFFSALQDAVLTGPTGTNVMDIQVIAL